MNTVNDWNQHQQEYEAARQEFEARRSASTCTCRYELYGVNAGTSAFQIREELAEYDPFCPEHGEPDCCCFWGKLFGDWTIVEHNADCPVHGD